MSEKRPVNVSALVLAALLVPFASIYCAWRVGKTAKGAVLGVVAWPIMISTTNTLIEYALGDFKSLFFSTPFSTIGYAVGTTVLLAPFAYMIERTYRWALAHNAACTEAA